MPYASGKDDVDGGTLSMPLDLSGDTTAKPSTHVAFWTGAVPLNVRGQQMEQASAARNEILPGLFTEYQLSCKPQPTGQYQDFYDKVTTYVAILGQRPAALGSKLTARTYQTPVTTEDDSVFVYADSATSRAGIGAVTRKLRLRRVAIIGLGGTGSYVLDLLTKCPVREIHIFDGDRFYQHNAFRSPGAASMEELRKVPSKVAYHHARYSNMHKGIVPHEVYIDEHNLSLLDGMDFVFLTLEGPAKRVIIERLMATGTPFVDVGAGVGREGDALDALVRVTTGTKTKSDHLSQRISTGAPAAENEYADNIQVADLNMLNAALAVVKWKKLVGFYHDLTGEHHTVYTVNGNCLTNEDRA